MSTLSAPSSGGQDSDAASDSNQNQESTATMKHFVYVANRDSNTISQFEIDSSDGHLIPIVGHENIATGVNPKLMRIHPTMPYLFVACNAETKIWVYQIDETTGALSLYDNQNIVVDKVPGGMGISADGVYFYVTTSFNTSKNWKFAFNNNNPIPDFLGNTAMSGLDLLNYTTELKQSSHDLSTYG
jgi:DNA-binding beta-propeller fold protein YncE